MKEKVVTKEIPAQDIFKKQGDDGDDKNIPVVEKPSEKEFAEAHTPELSQDTFLIAGKTFQLRMSNIKTQKVIAFSLDAVTDLIKKIDLTPVFKGIQDRLNRDHSAMLKKIRTLEGLDEKKREKALNEMAADGSVDVDDNSYMDIIELIQDVITHGGLGNITSMILDLYAGVVYAVCNSQDKTISRDWIEENLSFYDAQRIFFIQMEKDRIGGRVIDFLHMLTQQIVSGV